VLDVAAMITADAARDPYLEASIIIPEERDLAYALQLINSAPNWATRLDGGEYMAEERKNRYER
jgi:hypothetical protein